MVNSKLVQTRTKVNTKVENSTAHVTYLSFLLQLQPNSELCPTGACNRKEPDSLRLQVGRRFSTIESIFVYEIFLSMRYLTPAPQIQNHPSHSKKSKIFLLVVKEHRLQSKQKLLNPQV